MQVIIPRIFHTFNHGQIKCPSPYQKMFLHTYGKHIVGVVNLADIRFSDFTTLDEHLDTST